MLLASDILRKIKKFASKKSGVIPNDLFNEVQEVLLHSFKNGNGSTKEISGEEFEEALENIITVTYGLTLLAQKHKAHSGDVCNLIQTIFDCVCEYKDVEIAQNFERIFPVALTFAVKLDTFCFQQLLENLQDITKCCLTETGKLRTQIKRSDSNPLLSLKTAMKLEKDADSLFSIRIVKTILNGVSSFFGSDLEIFWPSCQRLMEIQKVDKKEVSKSWFKIATKISKWKMKNRPLLEQLSFFNDVMTSIRVIWGAGKEGFRKDDKNISELFEEVQKFIEENNTFFIFKKEARETAMKWLAIVLKITEDENNLPIAVCFATWIVNLSISFESPAELSRKVLFDLIEVCLTNIKKQLSSAVNSTGNCKALHIYLDTYASLLQLSRIQKNDLFDWIENEVSDLNSYDNPRWPVILKAFLCVQHPHCQKFFRKFIPPIENLWLRIKRGDSRKTVNTLSFLTATCCFANKDEGGKQIIPILLLNCLKELQNEFGQKWNNFRVQVAEIGRSSVGSTIPLLELEQYVQSHSIDESTKIRALCCALQIDKKPNQLVQLISDVAVSIIKRSKSIKVTILVPSLTNFINENYQSGSEIANAILMNITGNITEYSEDDLILLLRAVSKFVCVEANKGSPCSKCESANFCKSNEESNMKLNEEILTKFVNTFSNVRTKFTDRTTEEFLNLCKCLLLHANSDRMASCFKPVFESIDFMSFSINNNCLFCWQLIQRDNIISTEENINLYIRSFIRTLTAAREENISETVAVLLKTILNAKMPEIFTVIGFFSTFAYSSVLNEKKLWFIVSDWAPLIARFVVSDCKELTEPEILQIFVKRYASIFVRCFVSFLLFQYQRSSGVKDESLIRDVLRVFVTRLTVCFKFRNILATLSSIRHLILYWALAFGAREDCHQILCTVIDFLCQELVVTSPSLSNGSNTIPDMNVLKAHRKALVVEIFPSLIENWRFETCLGKKTMWRFCEEHCGFQEADMAKSISLYRKEVLQPLLIVAAEDFPIAEDQQTLAPIVDELVKLYDNLIGMKKFCISSAMDYRSEGIDFLLAFRRYFTKDEHFWSRSRATKSFLLVVKHCSKKFFDENWWLIQLTLRNAPRHMEYTRLVWSVFVARLDCSVLSINLRRVIADIEYLDKREEVISKIWPRLNYSNRRDTILTDSTLEQVVWITPKEIERLISNVGNFNNFRKLDNVFKFFENFDAYPITLFAEHLRNNIDRGLIWKSDLPKLMSEMVGIVDKCRTEEQKAEICSVLAKVPIMDSFQADVEFQRWDKTAAFFTDPSQRTQKLLDECAIIVEKREKEGISLLDYADRSLCEVYRYFDLSNCEKNLVRKSTVEGLKTVYARMNCQEKPDPELGTLKKNHRFIHEQVGSFNEWLTMMVSICIQECDSQFTSFAYIAHVRDTNFIVKILTKLILHTIFKERDSMIEKILSEFEHVLDKSSVRRITKLERCPAAFVFYIFDFLYFYMNHSVMKADKKGKISLQKFWKRMIEPTMKDEYGHNVPLIVSVAEKFGMEKRCILWMEMFMELKTKGSQTIEKQLETSHYYTLMNLYSRIHDLNGVRGAYNRLSRIQVDHLLAKICLREAFGNVSEASAFYRMTPKSKQHGSLNVVQKAFDAINTGNHHTIEGTSFDEQSKTEDYEKSLINLMKWEEIEENFEKSPHGFARNFEFIAKEVMLLKMINEGNDEQGYNDIFRSSKMQVLDRLEECAMGGSCSYETAYPYVVQLQMLDEITQLKESSVEDLIDVGSQLWTELNKRTDESEQRLDIIEPILRVRRSLLNHRMSSMTDREKQKIESIIVDTHLHCARVARLNDCRERAQLAIIDAKKVLPFSKKILFEEAMLQLQTSDEESGMNLLNSLLATTFGELTKHFGDTQQTSNLDLKTTAKTQIENFPKEEKNLYSSVQMLRISHMIKAGNTIGFEKIYEETTNLLSSFVSSGVMYEAAWLLDYLFHFNERNKTVLPLLQAYRDVAKYEKNSVLQARAIERMTSLWLENSKKLIPFLNKKSTPIDLPMQMKKMNTEMGEALNIIGWKAFYSAYAILARKIDHEDMDVFKTIKRMMIKLIVRLPHQCMWQSVHLLRSQNSQKIKRYQEVLNHVKLKHACYATIIDQYDYASAAFIAVSEKVRTTDAKLSIAVPQLEILIRKKMYDPKSLEWERRNEPEQNVIGGIMIPVRSDIDTSVQISKEVAENEYTVSCEVDDRYRINNFVDEFKILASMTKPVLIEVITSSGRKLRLMCKKEDDLAKDYHFTKIVEMCNDLLKKDDQTRIMNMHATTYSVIPLAKTGGIIEFIDGVLTYFDTLNEHMNLEQKKIAEWSEALSKVPKEEKTDFFRGFLCKQAPLVMSKWFRVQYPEAGKWFASRKLFAKSSAVMSIIGYIFGLGDRHTKNVLIHRPTGKCVHVDFDMIFNMGEFLETPEVVPFRLTRNMINGMGEVAMDGEFRTVCERTLRVFRENSYEIEKYIADLPDLVSGPRLTAAIQKIQKDGGNRPFSYDMRDAKNLISGRLKGLIITARMYKKSSISHPMKVEQLASSLIELATSDEKLVEMFWGWLPNM